MKKTIAVLNVILAILSVTSLTACVGDSSSSDVSVTDQSQHKLDNVDGRQQYTVVNINSSLSIVMTEPVLDYVGESKIRATLYLSGVDSADYKLNIDSFKPVGRRSPLPIYSQNEDNWVIPSAYLSSGGCLLNATDAKSECTLDVYLNRSPVSEYDTNVELVNQSDNSILKATLRVYVSSTNGAGYVLLHDKYIRLQLLNN